jgi:SAM-dependent methyltransferase
LTATPPTRTASYGQARPLNLLDRAGVWLRLLAVRRHANLDDVRLGDFGCGYDATITRALLDRVSSALLVDLQIAPDIEKHPKVTVVEGSIEDVVPSLDTGSLDVVLCLAVLEHLSEREAALQEFRRLLAPGGVLVITVPSWQAKRLLEFSAFRLGILSTEEMDDHKRYFGPRDLWPMLVDAGFEPSAIRCRRRSFGFVTFAACRAPGEAPNS